jgi:hypothetical protein
VLIARRTSTPQIAALVRLLARQAAREHLERLANPETDATDEE